MIRSERTSQRRCELAQHGLVHSVRTLSCTDSSMDRLLGTCVVAVMVLVTMTAATPQSFALRTEHVIADSEKSEPTMEDRVRAFARTEYVNNGQRQAFIEIIRRESRFDHTAVNPDSGAYGLGQANPASKMYEIGDDWKTNYLTQLRWVALYIKARYGTPKDALKHHDQKGWY